MVPIRRAAWSRLAGLLLAALLVAACGAAGGGQGGGQGGFGPRRTATPTVVATPRPAGTTAAVSPYTLVRAYTDATGREVKLYHGRGVGRSGDWGWAHIVGKHLKGEWSGGGPITKFEVIGVTTPEAVQEIIGRVLKEDSRPDDAARGRREYRLKVGDGRYEVLTVVGGDGAIITAYPDRASGSGR